MYSLSSSYTLYINSVYLVFPLLKLESKELENYDIRNGYKI